MLTMYHHQINDGVPEDVLVLLREVAQATLASLAFTIPDSFSHYNALGPIEHLLRCLLASPSAWVHLTSFTLRVTVTVDDASRAIQCGITLLSRIRPAKNLREVTIDFHHEQHRNLATFLCSGPTRELCQELEKNLLNFLRPNLCFSFSRPIHIRKYHSWTGTFGHCFPRLAERHALTIKAESCTGKPGHDYAIGTPIVISTDSRWAATGSDDGTIIVWDLESGCISQEWFVHGSGVQSLAFSPDSRYVVSASRFGGVDVWDLLNHARKVRTLIDDGDLTWKARCAWSADGTFIAAECGGAGQGADHRVQIWEAPTFQRLHLHEPWDYLKALSDDGRWIIIAGRDRDKPERCCGIWNVASGNLHRVLRGHTDIVNAAAFNPGSTRVATASSDYTIRIWDVETGVELLRLQDRRKIIEAIKYSPDGKLLLSRPFVNWDVSLAPSKIWDASSGALCACLSDTSDRAVYDACFSPCGHYVASGSEEGKTLLLWRTTDGSCIAKVSDGGGVSRVAISPDGRVLCFGGGDGTVFIRRMSDLVPADEDS
ncbi:quinon protein alcohol dehydrogenase-like superfamily [Ganoderma leucocontextum]|nr:quinon protein alcohol dehydrogenase-like superfamily [Ganoderma leucocontextum]